jgi:hypothetical protein
LAEVIDMMLAKEREQRYQTPADLVLDLECLLRGEPPRLARQRSQFSALEGLAHGPAELPDAEIDEEPAEASQRVPRSAGNERLWLVVLTILFAMSLIANLILLAK